MAISTRKRKLCHILEAPFFSSLFFYFLISDPKESHPLPERACLLSSIILAGVFTSEITSGDMIKCKFSRASIRVHVKADQEHRNYVRRQIERMHLRLKLLDAKKQLLSC